MKAALRRFRARLRGPGAWRLWAGMFLALALAAYTAYKLIFTEQPEFDLRELLARITPGDLAAALAVYSLALLIAIAGWAVILGTMSGFWRPFDHARIYMLTAITRRLPGTFWYVLGRMVMYERLGVPRAITALAGGFEFATNVIGGVLVALLAWPLMLNASQVDPRWLLVPLALGVLLLNPPLVRWMVRRLSPQHVAPPVRYRHLVAWVLIFALVWCVGGALLFVLIRAVTPLPLSQLPAVIGAWATLGVASTLFFSFLPFGLGATELTLAALLGPLLPAAEALFVAVLMRALLTAFELGYAVLGGLLSLGDLRPIDMGPAAPGAHPDAENPGEVFEARPVLPPEKPASGRH